LKDTCSLLIDSSISITYTHQRATKGELVVDTAAAAAAQGKNDVIRLGESSSSRVRNRAVPQWTVEG